MRDFAEVKRIVIKVGTNVLGGAAGVAPGRLAGIARQMAALTAQRRQAILVTSGAIGMGATALGIRHKINEVKKRQACAAVGQAILMHEYEKAFAAYGQKVAQVLLTYDHFSTRKYYVNLKNTMETLLALGIVPIVNENDCVSIDEIDLAFGDNDKLSALVASKIDAQLLVLLTDVDGLYDRNPKAGPGARLIPVVYEISPVIEAMAGKAGSTFSTGGMASKLRAIRIAAAAGCKVVLANGKQDDVIDRIMAGEEVGTLFLPRRRLSNRKRWILNCPPEGHLDIDAGAAAALLNHKSLLLVGITEVRGRFAAGAVVTIGAVAKGLAESGAEELEMLLRTREQEPPAAGKHKAVVHVNNLVLLE